MTGEASSALSPADCARVTDAIGRMEARTSGEIVVLVAARAGRYRSIALALALLVALAAPWPLILLTGFSAVTIALIQAACVLAVILLTLDERLRLRLLPRRYRRERTHEAAQREFWTRGLTRTSGRTGVLIYVALAERYAEIVADAGVRARVSDAAWSETVVRLLGAASRGELAAGLIASVEEIGAVLADHLPPGEAGDELPNRVILID